VSAALLIEESSKTLSSTQSDSVDFQLTSGGAVYAAPAGGVAVTAVSSTPACVTLGASSVTVAAGQSFGSLPFSYGSATLPCTSTVTLSNALYGNASIAVTYQAAANLGTLSLSSLPVPLGAGLEEQMSVSLSTAAPAGGATVEVRSANPSALLIAPSATTVGAPAINLSISAGATSASFWVQAGAGASGTVALTATSATYTTVTSSLTLAPSAVVLYSPPPSSTTPLSGNSAFTAAVGAVYGSGADFYPENVSPLGGAVTVTAASSATGVGELYNGSADVASTTAQIPVGSYSASFTFAPIASGTTTVSVTASGFGTGSFNGGSYASSKSVTVSGAGMTLSVGTAASSSVGVGVGLEVQGSISLGAPAPAGGVTITVTSSDATHLLLSPDGVTAPSVSISVPIAAGASSGSFWIVGVATGGSPTVTASNPTNNDYGASAAVAALVSPVVVVLYSPPPSSTTPLSGNSAFTAAVGAVYGSGADFYPENVSPLGGAVTVTAASSATGVGELYNGSADVASTTAQIPVGSYSASFTFAPIASGTTTVSVTASGFGTGSFNGGSYASSKSVTVSLAAISLPSNVQVGSGLQVQMTGSLQASNDGGITVKIASSDATKLLISPDGVTAGQPFIDVFVNNGTSSFSFYVLGVAGATGSPTVTASTTDTQFTSGSAAVAVVEPELLYSSLPTSEAATSADAAFEVGTYVPGYGYEAVAAGTSLVVTISTSNAAVADLTTSSQTQTTPVTVTLSAGQESSPSSVSLGGVALHAVGTGTAIINATAAGVQSASQTVTLD